MSQQQPEKQLREPAEYGDVFFVQGEIAETAAVTPPPKDIAATTQTAAENSIKETEFPGKGIITESLGDLVVGQNSQATPLSSRTPLSAASGGNVGAITIGEALEATALTAGEKPVEWSDAAAIQAAEVRATGRTSIMPGGVAAAAQSAATLNARATRDEDKTKLGDILANATAKLPLDRPATRRDAEGVTGAEMRNDPNLTTHPAGVAASVAAAARLNQSHMKSS